MLSNTENRNERLLGLIEEWVTPLLPSPSSARLHQWTAMVKDLHSFLQVKYDLPGSAVITLMAFLLANACREDLLCERLLGKLVFSAEPRLENIYKDHSDGESIPPSKKAKNTVEEHMSTPDKDSSTSPNALTKKEEAEAEELASGKDGLSQDRARSSNV